MGNLPHPSGREFKNRLHRLGNRFEGRLPADRLSFFHEDVRAGEYHLAIESLCSNLDDFDVGVPQDAYDEIVRFSRALEVDPKYWIRLRRDDSAP